MYFTNFRMITTQTTYTQQDGSSMVSPDMFQLTIGFLEAVEVPFLMSNQTEIFGH